MNRTFDSTLDAIAAHELSELDVTTGRVVVDARARRASNDATADAPISAVDAMALCMATSAIGG
jgi:hypothetical protein